MTDRAHPSPKGDFVRSLPRSLPVREVVARAAAAGLSITTSLVRKTRAASSSSSSSSPTKAAKGAKAAKAAPVARAAAQPTSDAQARAGSKRAFILSFPRETPAAEIVAAGKQRSFVLTPNYVHWVRADAARGGRVRRKGAKGGAAVKRPAAPAASAGKASGGAEATRNEARPSAPPPKDRGSSEAERLLVDTAVRAVGIERAIELLRAAQGRLGRLLDD